jgi:putative peptidoglycan lipid II flippase
MSHKLIKSTAVTGGMTLLSRITGLIRDIIFARFLGASAGISADAFYVAFAIPNFFRRIFGEGAFAQSFVPVLTEHKNNNGEVATREFVSNMAGIFGLLLFIVTLIGVLVAPLLVMVLAPGFLQPEHAQKYALTVQMLRITFPYLMFISLVAMAAGVLNTHQRFGAAAFTPVLLNLSLIGAVVMIAPQMEQPVVALAWGVFVAGIIQLLFQIPFLLKIRMLVWPKFRFSPEVKKVFKLMGPAIIGSSMSQINMIVNRILASFLVTGSVSWLYFSDRLMEFPLGVLGIALATVILPSLSKKHANASSEEFSRILDWALRWVLMIGLPATVGLVLLSRPILVTLFQYQNFNELDVEMTARALMAFAFGLLGFIAVKVLAPGFFARQDTKTPAKIAMVAFAVNIVLSLLLVGPLKHVGLALAISLAAFVNAGLLFFRLRKDKVYQPQPGWLLFSLKITLASVVIAILLFWGVGETSTWLEAGVRDRILRLSFWIIASILLYTGFLFMMGIKPRHLLLRQPET